jgi:hypothetical protein
VARAVEDTTFLDQHAEELESEDMLVGRSSARPRIDSRMLAISVDVVGHVRP